MSLSLKQTKTDYGKIGACSVHGRAVLIVDLGIQHNTDIKTRLPQYHVLDAEGSWAKDGNDFLYTTEENESPDLSPKVYINFELPTKRIDIDGVSKPRWIGKEYTLSASQNALLPKVLSAANVEELPELLTKPVMIGIGVTSGGNDKIISVGTAMDGVDVPELENNSVVFDFDEPDQDAYSALPNWVQKKIQSATNFAGSALEQMVSGQAAIEANADHASESTDPDSAPFEDDLPY